MDDFKSKFLEDARDLIADFEGDLLELEKHPTDKELIEKTFRVMHTLKGVSGMYGFDNVGEITHHLETLYDFVRNGKLSLNEKILNLTFTSVDHIKQLLYEADFQKTEIREKHIRLVQLIISIISEIEKNIKHYQAVQKDFSTQKEVKKDSIQNFRIVIRPDTYVFRRGVNLLLTINELYTLGSCDVTAHFDEIPDLNEFNHSECHLFWEIFLKTTHTKEEIEEVFMFILEDEYMILNDSPQEEEISQVIEKKDVTKILQTENTLEKRVVIEEQKISSIKVSAEKLDFLMNLVSELVTMQAELSLFAEKTNLQKLLDIAENNEKLIRRLRENAFSICLVPIREMMVRFQRLVRDLSAELGKEIEFITEGIDTELDKTMIDGLSDPILHILRNSIDHGIESPQERIAKGKNPKGKIIFKASHEGANVFINISDDGKGINLKKVNEVAVKKGFVSADVILSDKSLVDIIFMPGFSTADKVSEVSGRGVGMDVVRKKISEIRGEIDLQTQENFGTSITIKLPLTLSIVDALLVKIDEQYFFIPLESIDSCSEILHEDIEKASHHRFVIEGELIPYIYLRKEFGFSHENPEFEQIIVVKHNQRKVGFVVDVIIGGQQAVLKPLGEMFKIQEIFSGASILGDGEVALVIDSQHLILHYIRKPI